MAKARMTLQDVCADLRRRGLGMTQKTLSDCIESGAFPFGRILSVSPNGRRTFLILGKDYEAWAEENVGPVIL